MLEQAEITKASVAIVGLTDKNTLTLDLNTPSTEPIFQVMLVGKWAVYQFLTDGDEMFRTGAYISHISDDLMINNVINSFAKREIADISDSDKELIRQIIVKAVNNNSFTQLDE